MASATSGEIERSDWLRRSDWQSLPSHDGSVHYGFWFASANVQSLFYSETKWGIFFIYSSTFLIKVIEEKVLPSHKHFVFD